MFFPSMRQVVVVVDDKHCPQTKQASMQWGANQVCARITVMNTQEGLS